jgi:predicted N-formylglutamate amidohydrolase
MDYLSASMEREGRLAESESAFELMSCARPAFPILLVCDHASNHIPAYLDCLGISADLLNTHIGWDIGSADVTRSLAERLKLPAVLCGSSRLVVDCNRDLSDLTAFPKQSAGEPVPGNVSLNDVGRERRAAEIYWPYHHEIDRQIAELEKNSPAPAIISIHSFTPDFAGEIRPWHIGVLWDKDDRIARPFMDKLSTRDGILVGDNEPYSGRHLADFTIDHHAEANGLPHLAIEIRQDLIATPEGVAHWAALIADVLEEIIGGRKLYSRLNLG